MFAHKLLPSEDEMQTETARAALVSVRLSPDCTRLLNPILVTVAIAKTMFKDLAIVRRYGAEKQQPRLKL